MVTKARAGALVLVGVVVTAFVLLFAALPSRLSGERLLQENVHRHAQAFPQSEPQMMAHTRFNTTGLPFFFQDGARDDLPAPQPEAVPVQDGVKMPDWGVQKYPPSPQFPTVISHIQKTGGSSFWGFVKGELKDFYGIQPLRWGPGGRKYWCSHSENLASPRKVARDCTNGYTSLFHGHGSLNRLLAANATGYPKAPVACYACVRDPISRLVSWHYYLRSMGRPWSPTGKHIEDYTVPELERVLQGLTPWEFSEEEMAKEPLKGWAGITNARNRISLVWNIGGLGYVHPAHYPWKTIKDAGSIIKDHYSQEQLDAGREKAIQELPNCVIGLLEDMPGSTEVKDYFMPWLAHPRGKYNSTSMGHVNGGPSAQSTKAHKMHGFNEEQLAVLRKGFADEYKVYDEAVRVHKAQLAYVRRMKAARL